ncbi:MAG: pilus assembly protein [Pseudoxanthomonas spadix]|nr:MAG: pilus assembly protein [Pseudoxanthomonas spadix]
MALRRLTLALIASTATLAGAGYLVYQALALQGQGTLAQAPLNIQSSITPAFMMAIDDSGSMMFQNQFPGNDGKGCWNRDSARQPYSFFYTSGASAGQLRVSGGTCAFAYSYGAHYRLADSGTNNNYVGIPPVDSLGFARSPEFNPAYFDPFITYAPWLDSLGNSYPNITPTNAPIDPSGKVLTSKIDLTVDLRSTDTASNNGLLSSKFRVLTGMTLPAGTGYQTRDTDGCDSGRLPGGGIWRTLASDYVATANCDVFIAHYLPTFYLKAATPVPAGYENVARLLVRDACGPGCDMYRYTIRSSDASAMQNFANWFSYYGNRHKSLIAGLTHSMNSVNKLRAGYFRISQYNSYGYSSDPKNNANSRVTMRDLSIQADKNSLFTDILRAPSWNATYNRQAVYAAGRQFTRTDNGAPVQLACQKNAVMLFTDGYSNGGSKDVGNVDGTMGVPFEDGNSNTLADIASLWYLNDASGKSPIRPDMRSNAVPVPAGCPSSDPRLDCQANQHVNFYGVTLNGRGALFNPDMTQDAYTDSSIYSNWPAMQDDNRSTIDDIWHAATNTRGRLVNARTPANIIDAVKSVLRAVGEGATPSGSIAMTGSRIGADSLAVVPFYETRNEGTDWYSTLTAQAVTTDDVTGMVAYTNKWEASTKLPSAASRQSTVWYADSRNTVRQFKSSNLSLNDLCDDPVAGMSLCSAATLTAKTGATIAQAVDYLLGDTSGEVRNGGRLRDRTGVLGDIINSTPVIVSPSADYGYRSLSSSGTSDYLNYAGYLTAKKNGAAPTMVYVGANDGMLHAFHGETGVETFAYVPSTSRGHMGNLLFPYESGAAGQTFEHRYFVDGPITVSDTFYSGRWNTTLVGSAGAGGKSVFALDVTNPTSFSANKRLWEINAQTSPAAQRNYIGNVLGRPIIVPIKTSAGVVSWKAIFGNGYGSANGVAALFVVDINSGNAQVITAEESGAPAGANGLGNIVVTDLWGGSGLTSRTRDGFADTVYAGDQKGALWKFDLRSATPANQTVPVFVAADPTNPADRQPIVGGLTAALGSGGGTMIYFGTGSFSFEGDADPSNNQIQTLYGINDLSAAGSLSRSDLQAQTILSSSETTRITSTNSMSLGAKGWYINLPAGERFVGYPEIANGVVFFPTYDPNSAAGCTGRGTNFLYGLNALNGSAALARASIGSPTGDTFAVGTGATRLNTGGSAPVKDVAVMTSPRLQPLSATATPAEITDALAAKCSIALKTSGALPLYMPRPCGRQSWRQVR